MKELYIIVNKRINDDNNYFFENKDISRLLIIYHINMI